MALCSRTAVVVLVIAASLPGCDDRSRRPTAPSSFQQSPTAPSSAGGFPPGVFTDVTISGQVFEMTATGRMPIAGVGVYCELCGQSTHSWSFTDANGLYSFTGVWNAGVVPTSLGLEKLGYVDPPGLPSVTAPNPVGAGWREVMVNGDTRFDMELVRR